MELYHQPKTAAVVAGRVLSQQKITGLIAMFTPSVVLLVIANTIAAIGAVLVALQVAIFETGRAASPALTSDAAGIANADLSWQQGELADAA